MHLFVLHNPDSESKKKRHFLEDMLQKCQDEGWTYELFSSYWVNEELNVKQILKKEHPIVVIHGGDGTIRHVIEAFWRRKAIDKVTFFISGGGTFNALSKNCSHHQGESKNIVQSIRKSPIKSIDLLELELEKDGKRELHIVQTGVLFVKNSEFTLHAAEIKKALKKFQIKQGYRSLKKALPYLEEIPSFSYLEKGEKKTAQGMYCSNNPYLITKNPIHSSIHIDDGAFNLFRAKELNYFQIGQSGSVLLLGKRRDLPFLEEEMKQEWEIEAGEAMHLNVDGDIFPIEKGTRVRVRVSEQKANIYC